MDYEIIWNYDHPFIRNLAVGQTLLDQTYPILGKSDPLTLTVREKLYNCDPQISMKFIGEIHMFDDVWWLHHVTPLLWITCSMIHWLNSYVRWLKSKFVLVRSTHFMDHTVCWLRAAISQKSRWFRSLISAKAPRPASASAVGTWLEAWAKHQHFPVSIGAWCKFPFEVPYLEDNSMMSKFPWGISTSICKFPRTEKMSSWTFSPCLAYHCSTLNSWFLFPPIPRVFPETIPQGLLSEVV